MYEEERDTFEADIQRQSAVKNITQVDVFADRALYAIEWDTTHDQLFQGIAAQSGQVLSATGTSTAWTFELRFPSHDELAAFHQCGNVDISLEVLRVYKPSKPDLEPWFGLTDRQYKTLVLAVSEGYYSLPRGCTTHELAEQLEISDQAVTERLRRAIITLVENTVMTTEHSTDEM